MDSLILFWKNFFRSRIDCNSSRCNEIFSRKSKQVTLIETIRLTLDCNCIPRNLLKKTRHLDLCPQGILSPLQSASTTTIRWACYFSNDHSWLDQWKLSISGLWETLVLSPKKTIVKGYLSTARLTDNSRDIQRRKRKVKSSRLLIFRGWVAFCLG